MNDFAFREEFDQQQLMMTVTHLADSLNELGVESPLMFGLDSSMELEQLQDAKLILEEALEKELKEQRRLQRPPCHIGPYADGICTICGMRQP